MFYIQPTFAGGEFDPQAWGRIDIQKYATGLRECENFFVHKFGSISNRPGFLYLGKAKLANTRCRLVPFVFSDDQAYSLEFGVGYIRFWNSDGSQVVDSNNVAIEVITTYTEDQLRALRFVQSADKIFISCYGVRPKVLTRYSSTNWGFIDFAYKQGPFLTSNLDDSIKITPSGTSGSITLTASNGIFQAGHVGSVWRLDQNVSGSTAKQSFTAPGNTVSLACGANCTWRFVTHGSDWNATVIVERSYDNGVTWLQLRAYTGAADGNYNVYAEESEQCLIRARVTSQSAGTLTIDLSVDPFVNQGHVTITGYTSPTVVTASINTDMPLRNTDATDMWYEAAWSDVQGYPAAIIFWEDRLTFAGTKGSPRGVWTSKTADYYNFGTSSPTSEDTDAISVILSSRKMSVIHTLVLLRQAVIALSEDGVNTISYSGTSLTPSSISQRAETYYGAKNMTPVSVGSQLIYSQETGGAIRDIGYDYVSDSYKGDEVSIYASHLVNTSEIVESCFQQEPDSMIWFVREDGVLLCMTYLKEQQVISWSHHTTNGEVESVCCIPYNNGTRLIASIKREINGQTVRYIERLSKRLPTTNPADQLYMDAAYVYDNPTTKAGSLSIPHLAGEAVKIVADGNVMPDGIVGTDGALSIGRNANKIAVGLGYTSKLTTLNIEMQGLVKGTMQGQMIKIGTVILRLLNSRGGKIGQDVDYLEEWQQRLATDYLGNSIALFTGDATINGDFEPREGGRVMVVQDQPMPMTILAIITGLAVGQ